LRCLFEKLGLLPAALLASGCAEPLVLGSDLLWSTDHETGDLAGWSLEERGGAFPGPEAGSLIEVTSEQAKSGRYSVKLTRPAATIDAGPLLFRELGAEPVYVSAWYFVPSVPDAASYWTIAQFRSQPADDPDVAPHGLNLNLKVLPGGQIVLVMFDNDEATLQAPLADPVPFVPLASWFQIEVLYENGGSLPGRITVWLDGKRFYEGATGPLLGTAASYFMPCNFGKDLGPNPVAIYVDDAAISLTRVTPSGVFAIQ
jgi:hypothetical protein